MFMTWLTYLEVEGMVLEFGDKAAKPLTGVLDNVSTFETVKQLDILTLEEFPAVFLASKPGVWNQNMIVTESWISLWCQTMGIAELKFKADALRNTLKSNMSTSYDF